MPKVVMNGITIEAPPGSSISVVNDTIYIDGKPWDGKEGTAQGIVRLEITGDLLNVESNRDVVVHGNVGGDVRADGDVKCADVKGDVFAKGDVEVDGDVGGVVRAGGDVACRNVQMDIEAGGDIRCGTVGGNVSAGGDVRHK